jgi:hypothetical protein
MICSPGAHKLRLSLNEQKLEVCNRCTNDSVLWSGQRRRVWSILATTVKIGMKKAKEPCTLESLLLLIALFKLERSFLCYSYWLFRLALMLRLVWNWLAPFGFAREYGFGYRLRSLGDCFAFGRLAWCLGYRLGMR